MAKILKNINKQNVLFLDQIYDIVWSVGNNVLN